MIGLLTHTFGLGLPKGDGCIAILLACCLVGGAYKLSKCKLRDCACCRWLFRTVGVDSFDDFNLVCLVHEVKFTSNDTKLITCVRVTAGSHEVCTQNSKKKLFQEPLLLTVEQGTTTVCVELLNKKKKALGRLEFDVTKDILNNKVDVREQTFRMKEITKDARNISVTLTIDLHSNPWEMGGNGVADEETGLMSKSLVWKIVEDMPPEQQTSVYTHLHKVQTEAREDEDEDAEADLPEDLARMRLLSLACRGPVSWVGSSGLKTGKKIDRYMVAQCPPDFKGYQLGLWKDEDAFRSGKAADTEIHLLRVRGVQSNTQKANAVMMSYYVTPQKKEDHMFYALDRGDAVWVELLTALIKSCHEHKEKRKADKAERGTSSEPVKR